MITKLLCLSAADTSPFAKIFLEYLSKTGKIEYDFAEIEPHILANPKFPLSKLLSHFCSSTPDFIMSFNGHYRHLKTEPNIPFIEMGDSVAGPSRHNRPFIKNPVEWEKRVVKVEPQWYSKIFPLEEHTIYQMIDSYRYVYLRHIVASYKKNPVKTELPIAFYLPDWNTHTDDILQSIYRYLDFCRDVNCGLYVGLSKAVLDPNDNSLEQKYKAKRKSIDTTLKIIQDEISKFNKEYQKENIVARIEENTNWRLELMKHDIKLLSIEPSSTTWIESLYLLKAKEAQCNKIRLVLANGQRFPGTDDFDNELREIEKYFKENLMRKDRHSTLGQIFTTTDRFYHFLGFQENFALSMDFSKIAKLLTKAPEEKK
ncbi:hypothetical protein LS73_000230 [Helicobacter muridarum]|uniref:Uncharacterized protein n=1 Tax=Helicobacter muridarum TaxID=216 RepID=A0A099TY94_9HELI|nr:hypothetical protein [Helicobacter muridarum]TLE01608.1 hypothetical protein LS73_000230 [Helicobacter muridarum]STQ86222.1 Uncharacterised protein [Helicobacter muridarum]